MRDEDRAGDRTRTRPVLDRERLAIEPLELAADQPGKDAVHATGRGRRNDGDGAVWIILRPRAQSGEQDKTDEGAYGAPWALPERERSHGVREFTGQCSRTFPHRRRLALMPALGLLQMSGLDPQPRARRTRDGGETGASRQSQPGVPSKGLLPQNFPQARELQNRPERRAERRRLRATPRCA